MFGDHTYLSGMTKSLDNHFRDTAAKVAKYFDGKSQKSVLDIGSNDGTQLVHYRNCGFDVLGVESSKSTAKIANDRGILTRNEFFNAEFVKKEGRKFDVINASGVFFHLEELHSVTEGIRLALDENGIFVVQFLYMKKIVDNCAFDQIYHEHLLYYTLLTIQKLLGMYDLELFDAELVQIHGGSIIGYVGHKGRRKSTERLAKLRADEEVAGANEIETYRRFAQRIEQKKSENVAFLRDAHAKGKRIYGMGAPVKGNTLLNYFGVGKDLVSCLVEINSLRKGLFAPGSHIPIVMEEEVAANPPDVYYVLSWNFKREILARHQDLVKKGIEFYFPVDDGS